jgi:hypothetical protein
MPQGGRPQGLNPRPPPAPDRAAAAPAPARSCRRRGRSARRCRQRSRAYLRRSREIPCGRSGPQGAAGPRQRWDCRPAWASPAEACAAPQSAQGRGALLGRGGIVEGSRRAVVKAGDHGVGQLHGRMVKVHFSAGQPGVDAGVHGEGVIVERAGHLLCRGTCVRRLSAAIGDYVVERASPSQASSSSRSSVRSAKSRAESMRSTRAVSR